MTYSEDKNAMTKDKKFQHKCLFDENLAYCKKTGIWCLMYTYGKGMFCSLCRLTTTVYAIIASRIWNCKPK